MLNRKLLVRFSLAGGVLWLVGACTPPAAKLEPQKSPEPQQAAESQKSQESQKPGENAMESSRPASTQLATFGAGCFWCSEAVFQQLRGVQKVVSGYGGGQVEKPTYEQVCAGTTGHAECIQVTYDPAEVSYEELLEVFFKTHDPTTLNRQGNDFGTQYRSVIFYHSDEQRAAAEKIKQELDAAQAFTDPIVTEITAFTNFYAAEDYHQNYFADHPQQSYCAAIIRPKVDKFQKVFQGKLKAKTQ